jgi:hypothetical protein
MSAYERHTNAYVTKPVDLDQFALIISATEEFWLGVCRLSEAAESSRAPRGRSNSRGCEIGWFDWRGRGKPDQVG